MIGHIPSSPADVTPEWLTSVLNTDGIGVTSVDMAPVGTGQTGAAYRATVAYSGNHPTLPDSYVVKLPSQDDEIRARVASGYRTEYGFYSELADRVQVPMPKAYHCAVSDDGLDFVLVMEDLSPAVQGDEVSGCSVHAAELAADAIAGLHGPFWCDAAIADFPYVVIPKATPEVASMVGDVMKSAADVAVSGFGDRLGEENCRTLEQAAAATAAWLTLEPDLFSVLHGDYRLNNVLYAPDESWIRVVDWQSTTIGMPARDLSYFVVSGLLPEVRAANERDLVGIYHEALARYEVKDYDIETCWRDYRLGVMHLNLIATLGYSHTATPTHKSEQMMQALFTRSCRAIRELETLELIDELSA